MRLGDRRVGGVWIPAIVTFSALVSPARAQDVAAVDAGFEPTPQEALDLQRKKAAAALPPDPMLVPVERCRYGISDELTHEIFDFVSKSYPPASHCLFAGVDTRQTVLGIRWTFEGKAYTPVRISPAGCLNWQWGDPKTFKLEVPEELLARCPDLTPFIDALRAKVSHVSAVEGLDKVADVSRKHLVGRAVGIGVAVVLAIAVILVRRRERRRELGNRPPPAS